MKLKELTKMLSEIEKMRGTPIDWSYSFCLVEDDKSPGAENSILTHIMLDLGVGLTKNESVFVPGTFMIKEGQMVIELK